MNHEMPIIGHAEVQEQLVQLVQQHKLPHALLMTGARGIGKAAVAETLARCLLTNALQSEEAGLFGETLPQDAPAKLSYDVEHPAIARLEAGGHGNFKRVEPLRDEKKKMSFTTISIEQIRDVVEFMHLSTSEKGWRIVMIDPADAMNRNAENALLKVLEEPPKQTLLILVTHQPDRLLPTTRSRCREIRFHPPTEEELLKILAQQGVTISPDQQQWLSVLAPRSAGQWQRYVQDDAYALYQQWLDVLVSADVSKILSLSAKYARLEVEAWQLAGDVLLSALHRLVLSQQMPLELLETERAAFASLTATRSDHWQECWQQVAKWWPLTTASNYDKKQVVQSLLFQAINTPKKAA